MKKEMMNIKVVNIQEKLDQFTDHWNPRIIGELNDQHVKVAKLKDEFIFHHHEHEDEMFLVIKGTLLMEFENETKEINAGEFLIVPRGVSHKPRAIGEVELMLFEPATTLNTGEIKNERTKKNIERI